MGLRYPYFTDIKCYSGANGLKIFLKLPTCALTYTLFQALILSEVVGIGVYNKLYSSYVNSAKCKTNSSAQTSGLFSQVIHFNLKKDFSELLTVFCPAGPVAVIEGVAFF